MPALTTPRKLTSQGEERKQQLVERAAELFAARGYADTRVIDICRAAGAAKGLFYWYFPNKEALFRELAESMRAQLRRHQAQAMDTAADPLVQLGQGTVASVRFMAEHAPFFALLEAEQATEHLAGVLREGTEVHVRDVARLVREGQAAGLVRDDDPDLLARATVGLVAVFGHFHRSGRPTGPLDDLARFAGRHVVHSLAADAVAARRAVHAADCAGTVQLR
jgi:AcrR family transcriptional regulator